MSKQDKAALRYLNTKGITNYNEKMRIIGTLKHDVPNLRIDNCKFVTAGLRMYFNHELYDEQSIRALDTVLNYIHKGNHTNEYDYDLNGLSLEELSSIYKDNIVTDGKNDRKRSEQIQRNGCNGYIIIPIDNYEQASKYSQYTSWCVTHGQYSFEHYKQNENRFYFCLKEGFENTPKNDEGAPLNDYGLSMIAVNIDINGDLLRITTRYNHEFNGENYKGLCSVEQLEDILDMNFYKVFLPYTREELHSRGIILFDEIQGLLDGGKNPNEIFDWRDDFYNGYARVRLNNKYNWINRDYRLVSPEQWFDNIGCFHNGYACARIDFTRYIVDTNGRIVKEVTYDILQELLNNGYEPNVIFDYVFEYYNGYARVVLDDTYNWISEDTPNRLVSPDHWYTYVLDFNENGYANARIRDKRYIVDTNGKILEVAFYNVHELLDKGYKPDDIFGYVKYSVNGYALVELNKKYNWISKDNRLVSPEQWFDGVDDFNEKGYALVVLNNKYNLIDTNGNIVSPNKWYSTVEDLNIVIQQDYK